jgi:single-strand DNA-binding protein
MASLNKIMLIGNVTRDPELKYTPKGSAVADLGLAVNRTYTNQNNEKVEETTFVDVELWGRLAEIAGEYAKKGRSIFIEGRLRMDSWEDKASGQKRSRLKVVGEGLQLLGGNRPGGASGGGGDYESEGPAAPKAAAPRPAQSRPAPSKPAPAPLEAEDDDIPF